MKKNSLQKNSPFSYSLWLDHRAQQFIKKSSYCYQKLNEFDFMLDPVVKPQEISGDSISFWNIKKAMLYFFLLLAPYLNIAAVSTFPKAKTTATKAKAIAPAPKIVATKASTSASSITTFNNHEALSAFAAIDFPLSTIKDEFTINIFKTIDMVFAKSPYPLDSHQISTIKKTYL